MKNNTLKKIPPTKPDIASSDLVKICNNVTTRSQSGQTQTSQLIPTARKTPGDRKNLKKEKSQNMDLANISPTRPSNTVLNCPICNVTIGTYSFRLLSFHLKISHKNVKSEKININGMFGYFDCDDCMIPHHSSEFCTTIDKNRSLDDTRVNTEYENLEQPGLMRKGNFSTNANVAKV